MKSVRKHIIAWVAPLLGGAILLFSCSSESAVGSYNPETMLTQQSDTLTVLVSQNGVKSYRFYAPLMERYELAAEPYMEFRRGVDIITYDSLGNVESTLKADYGISYEKTDMVYSNVDCMVREGDDYFVGEGFESDSDFKDWRFRNQTGRIHVDMSQMEGKEEDAVVADDEAKESKKVGAK